MSSKPPTTVALDPKLALKPAASVASEKSSVAIPVPMAVCHALRLVKVVTVSAWADFAPSKPAIKMKPNSNFLTRLASQYPILSFDGPGDNKRWETTAHV